MMDDKIGLEILGNRFQAIVDEMAQALFRTAHTVFIKETQDYGAVLVSPKGEVFAASRRYGVLMMVGMPMDDAIRAMREDIREGDIFMTNDPEATGGMCTHLNDVYLWKPIFHEGRLLCFAWTFVHMSDVGGRVSGSIAPSSTELMQEGIRIPPQKLFREGVLDEMFLKTFLVNTRTGDQNWGDMKACIAALSTAERRVGDLIGRFGVETVSNGIDKVLDYAETQARRVIATVPEGTYRFSDFIEADMVGQGMLRVNLALTVKGGEFHMDFSGTAPQVRAALNLPSFSKDGHWMLITGVVNWLCTREPSIAYNAGLVRPMKVHIPKGTLINPEAGAAYGARYSTSHKVCDVIIGALAKAVPDQLPATDSGQGSILLVALPDMETGATKVSVIQPIVGGSGGRPVDDGVDGTMVILNFLKNVPTELLEREMPEILIRHYGLREDSGGAGRYRGGTGSIIEFQTFAPYTTITSRNMERYIFPPAGRQGGTPGTTGYTLLNPGSKGEKDIGKIDILEMDVGDILRIGTQGGGGYGDPLSRPAQAVIEDVLDGYVSPRTAEALYGVVAAADGSLDAAATEALRAGKRASRDPLKEFDFGPVRDAYHARWPDAMHDAISEATQDLPRLQRQMYYRALYDRIDRMIDAGESVIAADVPALLAALRSAPRRAAG
ncbi:hydantoinase B/oxoprolinase family protein [Paracoccus sp. IB05]|uniref:hydantoinase B/oxoprolinase family protein n=1 Tax=Paracoccus sp. IB05 TaxID=2779367 RepID=UPI0018E84D83|nr:hydantoinase B/oxoprolinase family protein [Paracoccus sp. IB05]MBJ2150249.1 hydantoinase B/oxoprolinase family protein [Paracoccus sp. IB05]